MRGNRGRFRGKNKRKDYSNEMNNQENRQNQNQNQNNQNHRRRRHYKKHNNNINDMDDYFNAISNNEQNGNNYEKKIDEQNIDQYNNIFAVKSNNEVFQEKKKNNKNYENENNNTEGFNKSDKGIKRVRKGYISYQQLVEIIDKDDNEIMQFFMKFRDISDVVNNTKFKPDMVDLMTELLAKISNINSGPATTTLNQIFINTEFVNLIRNRLSDQNYNNTKYLEFLKNVAVLSNKLIDKFTDDNKRIKCNELSEYSEFLKDLINDDKIQNNNLELALKILDIMNDFKEKERHKRMSQFQEKEKERNKMNPNRINDNNNNINNRINDIPIDYKEKNIQLTKEDFNEKGDPVIAPHLKAGSYTSYERYINTMFYLEYEDCYRDLRKTINIFQSLNKSINEMEKDELYKLSKKYSDLYFYLNGQIIFVDINKDGVILTIDFRAPSQRKIKFTKRMITNSLVILTDNNYENYLLTTVFYNPYVDKKINDDRRNKKKLKIPKYPYYRVQLSLVNINPESFLFLVQNRKNLQIFESKAYFESYIHVLKRLKEINVADLPFKEELIDANFNRLVMRKINPNLNYRYNNLIINPYEAKYPTEFRNLLDDSQLNAIHKCLLYKIALIQGPPGTGKTHVGTILANLILQNLPSNSQILVVCFTNHALDSFIENILKYTDNVVRIGGRCKNEVVKEKALDNRAKFSNRVYRGIIHDLDIRGENMKEITSLIDFRKKVNEEVVKRRFSELYNKVINDFFELVNEAIPVNWKINLNMYANREINKKIYIFWNNIDKNNTPREIILTLLDNLNIKDKVADYLYEKIYNNLQGYNKDNIVLLKYLNNYNFNELANNNINENNSQEEEEEEDDDEEELAQNLDRLDLDYYLNELDKKEKENVINDKEIVEEYFDENDNDLKKLVPLNTEKFNYLLNCEVNCFKFGPKVIKLIIDYMKNELLLDDLNNNNGDLIEFNKLLTRKQEFSLMSDAEAIKNYKIVAMTTTGCAKYSTILEQNNFETIIIEEAAEVLESHVLSLLTKNTKQLILIGDHKQLKPKPYNFELETKYNFSVSMFERLINNNIPYAPLKYQRRMKPKFADFVRIIYGTKEYIDYKDVYNKEDVKGMESDMYFITHNKLEGENEALRSKQNDYEAKYLTKLCSYLVKQGYNSNQITILTFYVGQVLLIKKYLRNTRNSKLSEIRVSSVDNYQGEECDIILLSLVRNNKKNEIGFLRNFNRVCVAFSRAKIGLYIIGNIKSITQGEMIFKRKNKDSLNNKIDEKMLDVWEKIQKKAEELNIIGDKLTLVCQNHKNKTIISSENDFDNCPEGGCNEICRKRMKCGHVCEKTCHVYDCNSIKCLKPCPKINPNCSLQVHKCSRRCYEDCGRCEATVDKLLPCGHIKEKCKCYENTLEIKCNEKCNQKLKCGHKCQGYCWQDCNSLECKEKIRCRLACGHINEIECHLLKDLNQILCQEKCDKVLPCGHKCQGTCGECLEGTLHKKCESNCGRNLPCGHICAQKCSSECLCEKKCPNICDHGYCDLNCCEICMDCMEDCKLGCKHGKCKKICGEICDRKPCDQRCDKKMKCGHQCYGICGERCPGVCRICNPDLECFTEDFFYKCELEEDALLYKTNCGHLFEKNGLDHYFESQKNIQMYTCPQCKSLLILEPRYQKYIKTAFSDIQKIKQVSLDRNMGKGDDTFLLKSQKIIDRILNEQYEKGKINIFDLLPENNNNNFNVFNNNKRLEYNKYNLNEKMPIIFNLCKNVFKSEKDINSRKNTTYSLLTLAEKFMGIEYYVYLIKTNGNSEEKFIKNFNIVKRYFKDFKGQFNNHFFNDLKKKIDNMLYYCILKMRGSSNNLYDNNINIYNNRFGIGNRMIYNNNIYNQYQRNNFMQQDDINLKTPSEILKGNFSIELDLKDLYKNAKIDFESLNLLRTLGTTWYRCPYGHLYVVGECGGPMQQSRCPECGQIIGGRDHVPANRNMVANLEFDMRNININDNRIQNPILNQDQEALNNMNQQHNNNQQHHMDGDIRQLIENNPEMNNYFNNNN